VKKDPPKEAAAKASAAGAPAPVPPKADATPASPLEDPASATPPAAFQPREKFMVDKKELEVPKWLIPALKDAETEKEAIALLEKAHGLEVAKPRHQALQERFKQVSEEHQGLTQGITELREMYARNDFDGFFSRLKIPQEKILQWVADKIDYNQLPQEQRQALDARKAAEEQLRSLERDQGQTHQQHIEQIGRMKATMLDMALEKADVQAFSNAYADKTGKSFRDSVIDYAEAVYFTRKDAEGRPVDLTPDQAIKEVMDHYGKLLAPAAPAPTSGAAPGQVPPAGAAQPGAGTTPPPARQEPPVIPNVSGRQTSPTASKPKSLDDLRKIRAQKFGN
jgi:hypothetical protein